MSGPKPPDAPERPTRWRQDARWEADDVPLRTCPNCGAALTDRSCKLLCPTPGCGYYLSCSDFL
jgi:hypothetical protein